MKDLAKAVRLPQGHDAVAPVTILDAQGHVLDVVTPEEFRRTHPTVATSRFSAIHPQRGGK
jgi:hypothetical protein